MRSNSGQSYAEKNPSGPLKGPEMHGGQPVDAFSHRFADNILGRRDSRKGYNIAGKAGPESFPRAITESYEGDYYYGTVTAIIGEVSAEIFFRGRSSDGPYGSDFRRLIHPDRTILRASTSLPV